MKLRNRYGVLTMAKFEKKNTALAVVGTEGENQEVSRATVKRVAPVIVGVSSAVTMPTRANNRGSKSLYNFDALAVGQSLVVTNKTAKQLASVITNANKRYLSTKKDAEGNVVYKTVKASDGNGGITEVKTSEAVMIASKRFFATDCDPATDPDGALVRIWREV